MADRTTKHLAQVLLLFKNGKLVLRLAQKPILIILGENLKI